MPAPHHDLPTQTAGTAAVSLFRILSQFRWIGSLELPNPDKANYRVVSWVLCDCDDATRVKLIHSFLRQLFPTIIVNFVLSKSGNAKDCDVMPLIVIELGWDGLVPQGRAQRRSRFHCWLYMMICSWKKKTQTRHAPSSSTNRPTKGYDPISSYIFSVTSSFIMALDPVKYNQKKAQDNLVAHAGAWTQASNSTPSNSVVCPVSLHLRPLANREDFKAGRKSWRL